MPAVGTHLHIWRIITNWIAFALVVMMLSGYPLLGTIIFHFFLMVKLPNQFAVPIYLCQRNIVLISKFRIASSERTHNMSTWQ